MTVRKISGTNVTVYVYVTPKVGATDGVTSNENGLIGYQRMEGTAVLKRENPDVYTDLTVKKKWSDSSDAFDVRPTSIKIQLYQDTKNPVTISESTKYGSSVTLNKANKWSYTWSDVPRKRMVNRIIILSERLAFLSITKQLVDHFQAAMKKGIQLLLRTPCNMLT